MAIIVIAAIAHRALETRIYAALVPKTPSEKCPNALDVPIEIPEMNDESTLIAVAVARGVGHHSAFSCDVLTI
jgi:hypothetical protein